MLRKSVKMNGLVALMLGTIGVPYAANVAPLYFENLENVTHEDSLAQQQYWEDLMKYKLWGSEGLTFNKENVHIADQNGYNGTSTGDISFFNGRHHVGGPLLSGGRLLLSSNGTSPQNDTLSGGPARVLGGLVIADWAANNGPISGGVYEGPYCIQGDIRTVNSNQYDKTLANWSAMVDGGVYGSMVVAADAATADSTYTYDVEDAETGEVTSVTEYYKYEAYPFAVGTYQSCPDAVPSVDTHLKVPVWPEPAEWAPAIVMNEGYEQKAYIHVPPEEVSSNEYGTYDLYLEDIQMSSNPHKYLYVVMPRGGRLTRIFSRDGINIDPSANSAVIQVVYVDRDAEFNTTTKEWDISALVDSNYVSNAKYAGNLMFYTKKDIDWKSMIDPSYQGTFMTTGKLTIKDHFTLAGQLVANNLWFESDIVGDFRYVPFDPPILNIDPELLENGAFPENNIDAEIPISLDERTNTSVDFNYCFDLNPELSTAVLADFNKTTQAPFPVCSTVDTTWSYTYDEDGVTKLDSAVASLAETKDSGYVKIDAGRLYPTDDFKAYLNVAIDGLAEGDEFLHMKIFNLAGAVLPGNEREGHFTLKIIDATNPPVASASSVSGKEDVVYTFKKSDFYYYSNKDYAERGIFVSTVPAKGTLTYKGDTLVERIFIPVDSIGDLKYVGEKDAYGTPYVTFLYQVQDEKMSISGQATMSVNLAAVNDAPTAVASVFTVSENSTVNTTVTGSLVVSDVDDSVFVYSLVAGDTSIFKIDEQTGVIQVKKAVLDYEKKDTYTVTVLIKDKSSSTGNEADICSTSVEITIKVLDKNETPVLADQEFEVKEHLPNNTTVGTVVYDELDTAANFIEDVFTAVGGDTALFSISADGVIKTKKELDYEKHSEPYTLVVKLADKNDPSISVTKTMTINVIDVNETPILADQSFKLQENKPVDTEIGTIVYKELDTAANYSEDVFTAVGGDTTLFSVTPEGVIKSKKTFDFEKDSSTYTLVVKLADKNDPSISVTKTMTINLEDQNESPVLEEQKFVVDEHQSAGTVVDTLAFDDLDKDPTLRNDVFTVVGGDTAFFSVDKKGVIKTKKEFDYETERRTYTIDVALTDVNDSTLKVVKTMTIDIRNINENPVIVTEKVSVTENAAGGTVVDTIKAIDKDLDDSVLTFKLVETSQYFEVTEEGVIKVKKDAKIDYEKVKTTLIVVEVTDSHGGSSRKTISVDIIDIPPSTIEITQAENKDTTWKNPDTLYTNRDDLKLYCSLNGGKEELCADTTLKEGKNVIVKTFNDPDLDGPASDTVVVFLSTTAPVVTVTANPDALKDPNIYTIVENTDASDTSIYVNSTKNDVLVSVKDVASKTDTSFTVKLDLDTLSVPQKTYTELAAVSKEGVVLNETPSTEVTRTPVNGSEVLVSYTEKVAGKTVTVTYTTDNNGDVVKRAVVNEKGKVENTEVITVSYVTKVNGEEVTLSYEADAVTGAVLYRDPEGNLVTSAEAAAKSSKKTDVQVSSYAVTYDYVDKAGNTVVVSYGVDKKGNLVKNGSGDIGYSVSYSYVNKYGNAATQSVFIVLDQTPPTVEILSPVEGDVVRSNFVNVVWTVNGIEQDTLTLQGLEKGANVIVRFYRDKAGNEASDTVFVVMKDSKDVVIAIEQPVTEITKEKVDEYYAVNPPKPGETFAVSIKNPSTGKEVETLIGGDFENTEGSGEEPYPGVSGTDHLGPTLSLDVKLPVVNGVGGLATLDDLLSSDGLIPLEGVDAENSDKVTVESYVENYCEDDVKVGSDLSRLNLYKSQMIIHIWVYTSLGNFVDYFSFKQDMDDPDYTNDAGMLQMFFEMKPDKDGFVRAENGKLIGTGAYLYKVEATIKSHLRCTLPPVADPSGKKMGDVVKSSDDLLKPFGYKRPKK